MKTICSPKSILIAASAILILFSTTLYAQVPADDQNPGSELDFYEIFNSICGSTYTSADGGSAAVFNDYGISDSEDDWWHTEERGFVQMTVRYAGYGQELGVELDDGTYYPVVPLYIPSGFTTINVLIPVSAYTKFAFVESYDKNHDGVVDGKWYSNDINSPNVDHFLAFDVLDFFADNSFYTSAWIIAFEDLPDGGDWDYNDLVVLVANVNPITTYAEEILLDAEPDAGSVIVTWTAVSEDAVLGYNLLRTHGRGGVYEKINDNLIAATGSIETTVDYELIDDDVRDRIRYKYMLEEIGTDGTKILHGPVKAVPRRLYRLFK